MKDSITLTEAIAKAIEGHEIVARLKANGTMYDVHAIIMPYAGINYPLVKLNKPFGNHRAEEVDLFALPK